MEYALNVLFQSNLVELLLIGINHPQWRRLRSLMIKSLSRARCSPIQTFMDAEDEAVLKDHSL
jgi:hypothetical protein